MKELYTNFIKEVIDEAGIKTEKSELVQSQTSSFRVHLDLSF